MAKCMKKEEWFDTFYNHPFADLTYTKEDSAKEISSFFESVVKTKSKVLDQCCGNGTIDIEISKNGHEVVGIDLSRRAIENAKQKSTSKRLDLKFKIADAREFVDENAFDVCTCWHTSCAYSEDDQRNIMQFDCMSRNLKHHGLFIIDTINPEYVEANFKRRMEDHLDDGTTVVRKYLLKDSILSSEWKVIGKNEVYSVFTGMTKLYTLSQYVEILASIGLRIVDVVGNYNSDELSIKTGRMIMFGEKI